MAVKEHASASDQVTQAAFLRAGGSREEIVAFGGLLGAVAASCCCILPLGLTVLGVTGAWMASLRALAPYQPVFVAMTVALLGLGFYLVYGKHRRACAHGIACARRIVPAAVVRATLWLATAIVALAITVAYWFPLAAPYLP